MSEQRDRRDEQPADPTRTASGSPSERVSKYEAEQHDLPSQIGRYRIVRRIGEGGMGIVYEAEQEQPHRRVALKVIRPGYASAHALKRFVLEQEVLGRLQHPGIAQIFDAGMADTGAGPQPYFAMEFIQGTTLLDYAGSENLDTHQRLDLLARICDAVNHAHQKGIIHRDLKPGNILVNNEGQPKILDFGVARATDADVQVTTMQTDIGQLIGTLQYMSPEQVAADPSELDVRSDVYALGVIAYQLLTGQLPYDLSRKMIHEAARVIREDEPTRLSSINRVFRGDVETIVAKALAKDKSSRYGSASDLGADIRRHLRDEPIVARPPNVMYQFRKFARRNRALVGGLVGIVMALVIGFVTSTYLYFQSEARRIEADVQRQRAESNEARANQQAEEARTEAAKARTIQMFLQDSLSSADPRLAKGPDLTVRQLLDAASERLDTQFQDAPEVEASLRKTIGEAYYGLMDFRGAVRHLPHAIELLRSTRGTDDPELAEALHILGQAYAFESSPQGVETLEEAVRIRKRVYGDEHPLVAEALHHLGFAYLRAALASGSDELFGQSEQSYIEALALFDRIYDEPHEDVARAIHGYATLMAYTGRLEECRAKLEEALATYKATLGAHPYTWDCLGDYALHLERMGAFEDALPVRHEVVAMGKETFGRDDPNVATALWRLGLLLRHLGKPEESERALLDGLTVWRRRNELQQQFAVATSVSLASLYRNLGRTDEAMRQIEETERVLEACAIAENKALVNSYSRAANALVQFGRPDDAVRLMRHGVTVFAETLGPEHTESLAIKFEFGLVLRRSERFGEAEALFRDLWEYRKTANGETTADTLVALGNYAASLLDQGKAGEAEPLFRQAYEAYESTLGHNVDTARAAADMAIVLGVLGRPGDAVPFARETLEIRSFIWGELDPSAANARYLLSDFLRQSDQYDEAAAVAKENVEAAIKGNGADSLEVARAAYALVDILRAAGRFAEAEPLARDVWEIRKRKLEAQNVETMLAGCTLGMTLVDLGRADEALPILVEAYTGCAETPVDETTHPARAAIGMSLAHLACSEYGRAQQVVDTAISMAEKSFAVDHELVLTAKNCIGKALIERGELAPAEKLLKQVFDAAGEHPAGRRRAATLLVRLYERSNRPDEAAKWRVHAGNKGGQP